MAATDCSGRRQTSNGRRRTGDRCCGGCDGERNSGSGCSPCRFFFPRRIACRAAQAPGWFLLPHSPPLCGCRPACGAEAKNQNSSRRIQANREHAPASRLKQQPRLVDGANTAKHCYQPRNAGSGTSGIYRCGKEMAKAQYSKTKGAWANGKSFCSISIVTPRKGGFGKTRGQAHSRCAR